ncbi:MAG TPA: hypothetical protein DEP46_19450 [Blastocatellia bacterium]|nr:hypothetical protein [Blastocatellia bacterium]
MKCPIDTNTDLQMSERQGIEIDFCPECRGVWLDRGEIDKIIERSMATAPAASGKYDDYQDRSRDDYSRDHHSRKRRKGFLSELFD